jgi:hypothetical protein
MPPSDSFALGSDVSAINDERMGVADEAVGGQRLATAVAAWIQGSIQQETMRSAVATGAAAREHHELVQDLQEKSWSVEHLQLQYYAGFIDETMLYARVLAVAWDLSRAGIVWEL